MSLRWCARMSHCDFHCKEDLDLWQDSYCVRPGCNGRLHEDTTAQLDYYGKLYSNGTLTRIIAHEHAGLLEREEREELEKEFKRKKTSEGPGTPTCFLLLRPWRWVST